MPINGFTVSPCSDDMNNAFTWFCALMLCLNVGRVGAAVTTVSVAVAANFTMTVRKLAPEFERRSGHALLLSFGSTGKLATQIHNGAPFDVFLSADDVQPRQLVTAGLAVADTQFTYAFGRLVLWSPQPGLVDDKGEILRTGHFAKLAIANPKIAPYGAAARQVLRKLGVWPRLEARLVYGENIAQTFQFVSTGNAALGFVALAQLSGLDAATQGSRWRVPAALHAPLRQDAVLLRHGAANTGARAFLGFLQSPAARAVIAADGYEVPR